MLRSWVSVFVESNCALQRGIAIGGLVWRCAEYVVGLQSFTSTRPEARHEGGRKKSWRLVVAARLFQEFTLRLGRDF